MTMWWYAIIPGVSTALLIGALVAPSGSWTRVVALGVLLAWSLAWGVYLIVKCRR